MQEKTFQPFVKVLNNSRGIACTKYYFPCRFSRLKSTSNQPRLSSDAFFPIFNGCLCISQKGYGGKKSPNLFGPNIMHHSTYTAFHKSFWKRPCMKQNYPKSQQCWRGRGGPSYVLDGDILSYSLGSNSYRVFRSELEFLK